MGEQFTAVEGGCDCKAVRYRLLRSPMVVHCCHCRWCQRESGSAFALNAMLESEYVEDLGIAPELIDTPSASGAGQQIARCPHCKVAVWSHYAGAGSFCKFIRVGSLDQPDLFPPDVHIFTASKQPWVKLDTDTAQFAEYYDRDKVWPAASLQRRALLQAKIDAAKAAASTAVT